MSIPSLFIVDLEDQYDFVEPAATGTVASARND